MKPILQQLIEIQESGSFDHLESFKNPEIHKQMSKEEKNLFSLLLLRRGAQLLAKGDRQFQSSFDLASEMSSYSAATYYQQGVIFSAYTDNSGCLQLASEVFARAVEADPSFVMAWYKWALTCIAQGMLAEEPHYFFQGNTKFSTVHQLISSSENKSDLSEFSSAEFYWKWGTCQAIIGRISGEPVDFYKAITHFRQADELKCRDVIFFLEYGQAIMQLSDLSGKKILYAEAMTLFYRAIDIDSANFGAHCQLAFCLVRIVLTWGHEESFEQAQVVFEKATAINNQNEFLWLKWGQLESGFGKLKRDQKLLESSLVKFAKANELDPEEPAILNSWAETELFMAIHQESLDLIYSAKMKILKSLSIQSDCADAWYIYGTCFNELGRYFNDEDYYYQAIDKFQQGLTITETNPLLWYGLSLSYFAIGETSDDTHALEKAVRYCAKVKDCGAEFSQFLNDWGMALMKLGELTDQKSYLEAAIEKFEQALVDPIHCELEDIDFNQEEIDLEWVYNYGCACHLLGEMADNKQMLEKAIFILNEVLEIDSTYSNARYHLALSLSHLGELNHDVELYNKSIEQYQTLVEEDSEDSSIQLDYGMTLMNLAILIEDAHQLDQSKTLFQQAETHLVQSAALGNCLAYYQLACLYSLNNQHALSMHYIERASLNGTLPSMQVLMMDDWLDKVRETAEFRQFLSQLSAQQAKEEI